MALLPWSPIPPPPPFPLPPASDYRLKEEWAGLVRTCLPPQQVGGKLLSWCCFLFFEARSKVGPSWEP